ncbi:hypothetical protein PFICI_14840 [Pestalotiopsis fici W106-1]|uniref:Uncharacterized protein n=1 Tax=Pestalotiopsis fici (strain W106-1 / CGMCC3.15140) TaxID=1229662 RepID=W3WH56_PESFW|nr:uncharacterized protein PFICI_14840 [Pestalotiopsis fici W106-1]ETS73235.1 hypothetical protein PFICI_14840 [Pestalotiopsis fici W106-1]
MAPGYPLVAEETPVSDLSAWRRDRIINQLQELVGVPGEVVLAYFKGAPGHVADMFVEAGEESTLSADYFDWAVDRFVWGGFGLKFGNVPEFPYPEPEKYGEPYPKVYLIHWVKNNTKKILDQEKEQNAIVRPGGVDDFLDVRMQIWQKAFPESPVEKPFWLSMPRASFCNHVAQNTKDLEEVMAKMAKILSAKEFVLIARVGAEGTLTLTFAKGVDTDDSGVRLRFMQAWSDLCMWHRDVLQEKGVKIHDFFDRLYFNCFMGNFADLPALNVSASQQAARAIRLANVGEANNELHGPEFIETINRFQASGARSLALMESKHVMERLSGTVPEQFNHVMCFINDTRFSCLSKQELATFVWGPIIQYARESIGYHLEHVFVAPDKTGMTPQQQLEVAYAFLGRLVKGEDVFLEHDLAILLDNHTRLELCEKAFMDKGPYVRLGQRTLKECVPDLKETTTAWVKSLREQLGSQGENPIPEMESLAFK